MNMKKTAENRYPHSATLFKFCKEALEIRYEGNVKVIDQDVGSILGYDPADCSHWKKGKKNIRALNTLRSIASHLNVDEKLLIDIVAGKIDLEEAIFEFKGYGTFNINSQYLEQLKKEFFKNPGKWQREGGDKSFEEIFDLDRDKVIQCAYKILEDGDFKEAPIYIPEIFQMFPNVRLVQEPSLAKSIDTVENKKVGEQEKLLVLHKENEMRPYIRFLFVKKLFRHLVSQDSTISEQFKNTPEEILNIQSNIFAGHLLVPGFMLQKEVEKIDITLDLVSQLAEVFWVSKSLMNQRLREYMEYRV